MTGVTAKISSVATDSEGTKVTEQLGYTSADVFDNSEARTTIKNFVQSVTALTTNTFVKAAVNYEIDLDTYSPNPPFPFTLGTPSIDGGSGQATIPVVTDLEPADIGGKIYTKSSKASIVTAAFNNHTKEIFVYSSNSTVTASITAYAPETEDYSANTQVAVIDFNEG